MKKVATIKIFETDDGEFAVEKEFKAESMEDMREFLAVGAAALVSEVSVGFNVPVKQVVKVVRRLANEMKTWPTDDSDD